MSWFRFLLSMALIGGCVWCVGQVRQAYSQQQTVMSASTHSDPTALTTEPKSTKVAGLLGDLLTWW